MTTTTREELLHLVAALLGPDPLDHWDFCPKCGGGAFNNGVLSYDCVAGLMADRM